MVNDEIVQLAPVQHGGQILKELAGDRAVHRIKENRLLIQQHIRVVGHPPRDRVDVFKKLDAAVAGPHVEDVLRHLTDAADAGEFLFPFKGFCLILGKGAGAAEDACRGNTRRTGGRRLQEVSSCNFCAHVPVPFCVFCVLYFCLHFFTVLTVRDTAGPSW